MFGGVRRRCIPLFLALAVTGAGVAPSAMAADARPAQAADAITSAIREEARGAVKRFYAARDFRPLWFRSGKVGPSANTLIAYLESANLDGLKPSSYRADELRELIASARSGDPEAIARAEIQLLSLIHI